MTPTPEQIQALKAKACEVKPECCNRPVPGGAGGPECEPECCGQPDYPFVVDANELIALCDLALSADNYREIAKANRDEAGKAWERTFAAEATAQALRERIAALERGEA